MFNLVRSPDHSFLAKRLILEQKRLFIFLNQFNDYFTHIETSQSLVGGNRSTPGKPPDTPASRTWLVSHVASAGLEPTPDIAVR